MWYDFALLVVKKTARFTARHFHVNSTSSLMGTRTQLQPLYPQGIQGRSQKSQKEPVYNLYAPDLLLVFNADLARADFNGNFRNSTSALLHRAINIDTPTLCTITLFACFVTSAPLSSF